MADRLHSTEGARLRMVQVLDDYSRFILAWKLAKTLTSKDVQKTLELRRLRRTSIKSRFGIDPDCYQLTVHAMFLESWSIT